MGEAHAEAPVAQPVIPVAKGQQKPESEPKKSQTIPTQKKGLGGLASLDQIKTKARAAAQQASETDPSTKDTVYELDHSIQISEEKFSQALEFYVKKLHEAGKTILTAALQSPKYTLTANKWELSVTNQLLPDLLQRETELLPYLRTTLGVSNLFMEVLVDESYENPHDARPYTDEEKLAAMAKKNPSVESLMSTFKTRIAYE